MRIDFTVFLAFASFPLMNIVGSPPDFRGFTITSQLTIFRVLTTCAPDNIFCTSSFHEFVFVNWGINEGGMPLEKSSGLEISITTFPLKFVGFASLSTSRVESPFVQRNTTSPNCAASSNVPYDAAAPFDFAHATAFSFEAERDPILTE